MSAVALASLLCSGFALAALGAIRSIARSTMLDPRLALSDFHVYLVGHYRLLARTLALAGLAACLLYRFGPRHWHHGRASAHDALHTVLRRTTKGASIPFVRVFTTDGVTYEGWVAVSDASGEIAERAIVLRDPVIRYVTDSQTETAGSWRRVLIPYSRVTAMHVAYGAVDRDPAWIKRMATWLRRNERSGRG